MSEELHLSHIARVRLVVPERIKHLAQKRDASATGEEDGFFYWDAEISNNLLDLHFTRMNSKTLQNYAEDAAAGVAFLRGHDWHSLPVGYSVDAKYEEGEKERVTAGFYTVRGIADTDDLIKRMQSGLLRDVSVGFHGGRAVCDMCGQELWDCRHFPGIKYEEKVGDTVTTKLATFTIDDARLSEVSGVFDGSTPQAMILKAERAAQAGWLSQKEASQLERQYRMSLPLSRSFPVVKVEQGKEVGMTAEERLVAIRKTLGVVTDDEVESRLSQISQEVVTLKQRVAELEPQAADGAQYRTDLIEEALAEGVRAQGNDFDRETYEETLKSSPIKTIKRFKADWQKTAGASLPSGRNSNDTADEENKVSVERVPASGYRI